VRGAGGKQTRGRAGDRPLPGPSRSAPIRVQSARRAAGKFAKATDHNRRRKRKDDVRRRGKILGGDESIRIGGHVARRVGRCAGGAHFGGSVRPGDREAPLHCRVEAGWAARADRGLPWGRARAGSKTRRPATAATLKALSSGRGRDEGVRRPALRADPPNPGRGLQMWVVQRQSAPRGRRHQNGRAIAERCTARGGHCQRCRQAA